MSIFKTDSVLYPFFLRFFYTRDYLLQITFLHGTPKGLTTVKAVSGFDLPGWLLLAQEQLQAYLFGQLKFLDIPYGFLPEVKPSLVEAWKTLSEIPYGACISYESFACRIHSNSPRLAGRILSQNPLPLILPCHRVVRKDGALGGFTPLLQIKDYLLSLESGGVHA